MQNEILIIYKDGNRYRIGVMLEENGNKITIENDSGKKQSLVREKVLIRTERKREKNILVYQQEAQELKTAMDSKELYEVVCELAEEFSFEELTQLYFSENYSFSELFAVVLKAAEENIYFCIRKNRLVVASPQEVVQALERARKKEEEAKRKARDRETALQWIASHWNGTKEAAPPEVESFLLPLKEFVAHGEEGYTKKKEAEALIELLCKTTGTECRTDKVIWSYRLLVALQLLKRDDELTKKKFQLKTSFPALTEEDLLQFGIKDGIVRQDLCELYTFTVDDITTEDIDDGLSVEMSDDGFRFFIHIADPDAFIPLGTPLDREAFSRGTSIYLVTERVPMFPPEITRRCFNLTKGEKRPSVTLRITTDREFKILDKEFLLTFIQVKERLTYHSLEERLEESGKEAESFQYFSRFSDICREKRVKEGAYLIEQPDLQIIVPENGPVEVQISNPHSSAHRIVQEMMILFNQSVAEYLILRQLPSIFISQSTPDLENAPPGVGQKHQNFTRYELLQFLFTLKKSVIGTSPGPHFCMGLAYYTQATSPIRRYLDLTVHRILKASLVSAENEKAPPFSEEELKMIAVTVSAKTQIALSSEKESERFWLMRYLEENQEKIYRVLIIRKITGGYMGELEGYGLRLPVFGKNSLKLGSYIKARLKKVVPITAEIRGEYIELDEPAD